MKLFHFIALLVFNQISDCHKPATIATAISQVINNVAANQIRGIKILTYNYGPNNSMSEGIQKNHFGAWKKD
jgi:hypothetical protein